MLRERHVITEDIGERLVSVLAFERCGAKEHFVDQYTERPPVHCACVTTAFDDLWCYVLFCSDKGIRPEVGYT